MVETRLAQGWVKPHARQKPYQRASDGNSGNDMTEYKFKCKDTGMKCDFEVKGASSKEEVMEIASVHARRTHGMETIPADMAAKVSSAIKS